jgi:hypothetical protein
MRIDEIANPLGAIGAVASGVARQLGRSAVTSLTGKDPDNLFQKTPDLAQYYSPEAGKLQLAPGVKFITPDQIEFTDSQGKVNKFARNPGGKWMQGSSVVNARWQNFLDQQALVKQGQMQVRTAYGAGDDPNVTAQNIPQGSRLRTTNPQNTETFYKYPNGTWTDERGTVMPKASWDALEAFADSSGQIEKMAPSGVKGFRTGQARRKTKKGSGV